MWPPAEPGIIELAPGEEPQSQTQQPHYQAQAQVRQSFEPSGPSGPSAPPGNTNIPISQQPEEGVPPPVPPRPANYPQVRVSTQGL